MGVQGGDSSKGWKLCGVGVQKVGVQGLGDQGCGRSKGREFWNRNTGGVGIDEGSKFKWDVSSEDWVFRVGRFWVTRSLIEVKFHVGGCQYGIKLLVFWRGWWKYVKDLVVME